MISQGVGGCSERSNRISYVCEFLCKIISVSLHDSCFAAAAERQSAVTVELDFLDPVTGPRRIDKLRFHRFHKVRRRNTRVASATCTSGNVRSKTLAGSILAGTGTRRTHDPRRHCRRTVRYRALAQLESLLRSDFRP